MNEENKMKSVGRREVLRIEEYRGTCYGCQGQVNLKDFLVLPVAKDQDNLHVLPLDYLQCPHCGTPMLIMMITGTHLPTTSVPLFPPKKKGLN